MNIDIRRRHGAGALTSIPPAAALAAVVLLALALACPSRATFAADLPVVRVGVLKFGTVNWELESMRHHGLDEAHGFELEVVPFAGGDATEIALQGDAVDVIVSDWLWVSRQRAAGEDLTFARYSSSVGAIMVPGESDIGAAGDLRGKKIGVAGGPLDKSWLLIQGMVSKRYGFDIAAENDIVYGAPPLLAEKARTGELAAVLNYWHYNARLEAESFREILSAERAAEALGASGPISSIGYVFREKWAEDGPVEGFLDASAETKKLLRDSNEEWRRLASSGAIKDKGEALVILRDEFRDGIPIRPLHGELEDVEKIYRVLAELGGRKLVGDATELSPGTYWTGPGSGS